jgi:hypothetical protein
MTYFSNLMPYKGTEVMTCFSILIPYKETELYVVHSTFRHGNNNYKVGQSVQRLWYKLHDLGSISVMDRGCSFRCCIQTGSGGHPAHPHPMGTRGSCPA